MAEELYLDKLICFPLYVASKELLRLYKPLLEPLGLTYTQFLVMLAVGNQRSMLMKDLTEVLILDSNTLTPVINKLVKKGYLQKERLESDERQINIILTKKGAEIYKQGLTVPPILFQQSGLTKEEGKQLYNLLYRLIDNLEKQKKI